MNRRQFIAAAGSVVALVIVRLGRALPPGIYRVSWRVVSIYERPSSGTFHFTVT
jgi:methionine-rich copper-binding protein CopC